MEQIPEFLRTEVWHPLSVHFPIALLIVATLFKIIALFAKKDYWNRSGSTLLYLGTIGAWVSIYTGDMADGIVSRTICDPTILKDHENTAYITAYLFTAAVFIDIFNVLKFIKIKPSLLLIATVLFMLIGSGYLVYVGHSGASLVYQQGAGVYIPSEDCREFE